MAKPQPKSGLEKVQEKKAELKSVFQEVKASAKVEADLKLHKKFAKFKK